MTLYSYKAFTKDGKRTQGAIEATTVLEAKDKIRSMQLMLSHLAIEKKTNRKHALSADALLVFTSQLSQLISSKIPLYESLVALEEQSRSESYHPVLAGLTERIKRGTSLSQAMADFSDSFSPLYRALISAGEAVGNMELTLNRLHSLLSHQNKIKKQLVSAMIYPALLLGLLFFAIGILVGFVIPSLESLFEDKAIPTFTQVVLSTSRFLHEWGLVLLGGLIGLGAFGYIQLTLPKRRVWIQKKLVHVPLIGTYVIQSCLGRFARTLSTLLEGGLAVTTALSFSRESINNARLDEIMQQVEAKIIEGIPLSQELGRHKEVPSLFVRMISIGEESGKLSGMLAQIATLYEEETERTLMRIVQLAQPVLLLVMGGLIGGVLLSILLPLSSFGSSIQM